MRKVQNNKALYIRNGQYYFRRTLSFYWRRILGRREFKIALAGLSLSEARVASVVKWQETERFLTLIEERMTTITHEDAKRLAQNFFERRLSRNDQFFNEHARAALPNWPEESPGHELWRWSYEQALRSLNDDEVLEHFAPLAANLAQRIGCDSDPRNPAEIQLSRYLHHATLEWLRIDGAMARNDTSQIVSNHPIFRDCRNLRLMPDPVAQAALEDVQGTSPILTLDDALNIYMRLALTEGEIEKANSERKERIKLVLSLIGLEREVRTIVKSDINVLTDGLKTFPKNFQQRFGKTGKTVTDIMRTEKFETVSKRTRAKYEIDLKKFFGWCENRGYVPVSPMASYKIDVPKHTVDARNPFSQHELEQIFKSKLFAEGWQDDDRAWMTLVGLYTGARAGEILLLSPLDVQVSDGVEYFNIVDSGDGKKRVKTDHSVRSVPIHPDLKSLGFLRFLNKKRKRKATRIFDSIRVGKLGSETVYWTKFFSPFLERIGVKTPKNCYHSFRHTFVQACRLARLPEDRSHALTGHKNPDVSAFQHYGRRYKPHELYQDMEAIAFGINIIDLLG